MDDNVEDSKSEIQKVKSLEEFQNEMKELIHSLVSEETDSLEGLVSLCNHGLNKIFKNCEVIKLRKLFSETEYILWSIIKINKDFVYTFIFRVLSQKESRSIKTYKKIEELNLDTLKEFTLRTFNDLFTFISSQERLDYSVVSDSTIENELSSFKNFLKHVSFKKNSITNYSPELPAKYKKRKQDLYHSNKHKRQYQHNSRHNSRHNPRHNYKYALDKKHNSKNNKNISQLRKKYRTYNPESTQKSKQKSKNRKYKDERYHKKREKHKHHKKRSNRQKRQDEHLTYEEYKQLRQENKEKLLEETPIEEKMFNEEVYTSSEEPILYSHEKSRSYTESKSSST